MTSLRKPSEVEEWIELLSGKLAPEVAAKLLAEDEMMFRVNGVPGLRLQGLLAPPRSMLFDRYESQFRRYLRAHHPDKLEIHDAAVAILLAGFHAD